MFHKPEPENSNTPVISNIALWQLKIKIPAAEIFALVRIGSNWKLQNTVGTEIDLHALPQQPLGIFTL